MVGLPQKYKQKYNLTLSLIAIPLVLFVFTFCYLPLFGWIFAFFNYVPGMKLQQLLHHFAGLKYFYMAFTDGGMMSQVLLDTFVFSILGLMIQPLSMIFAMFLSESNSSKFRRTIQTITTFPNFISWIIVYAISYSLFSTDNGVINNVLTKLHILNEPFAFAANADIAWFFQGALAWWKNIGFSAIIYFAAIAGIDSELYDAAKVDGAGRFKAMLHITVPGLMPTFLVLMLLGVSNILNNGFDQYYVFNNAMVADKLNVLDYYVYRVGMGMGNYSFSTAIGMFKTLFSLTLLFGVNYIAKKVRGTSMF